MPGYHAVCIRKIRLLLASEKVTPRKTKNEQQVAVSKCMVTIQYMWRVEFALSSHWQKKNNTTHITLHSPQDTDFERHFYNIQAPDQYPTKPVIICTFVPKPYAANNQSSSSTHAYIPDVSLPLSHNAILHEPGIPTRSSHPSDMPTSRPSCAIPSRPVTYHLNHHHRA